MVLAIQWQVEQECLTSLSVPLTLRRASWEHMTPVKPTLRQDTGTDIVAIQVCAIIMKKCSISNLGPTPLVALPFPYNVARGQVLRWRKRITNVLEPSMCLSQRLSLLISCIFHTQCMPKWLLVCVGPLRTKGIRAHTTMTCLLSRTRKSWSPTEDAPSMASRSETDA